MSGPSPEKTSLRCKWVSGAGVPVPVVEMRSPNPGPVVAVVANLHGDECTGIGVAHALIDHLPGALLRGTVFVFPTLNPSGLAAGSRGLPGETLDPNRCFPGDPRGRKGERHASRIWAELMSRKVEVLLDLHTDSGASVPYAITDRVVRGANRAALEAACLGLAEASGLTVLREYPTRRYLQFDLDRSLPGACVNGPGIAAVTLEVGPRRRIDQASVRIGLAAALGVLTAAGVTASPAPRHPTRHDGGPWRRESGPRANRDGVLQTLVEPGADVQPGQVLATVRALNGTMLEALRAERGGFVVALPEVAHVSSGVVCATLAVLDQSPSQAGDEAPAD